MGLVQMWVGWRCWRQGSLKRLPASVPYAAPLHFHTPASCRAVETYCSGANPALVWEERSGSSPLYERISAHSARACVRALGRCGVPSDSPLHPVTVAGILKLSPCQSTLFRLLFLPKQRSSCEERAQGCCCPAFCPLASDVAWHTCNTLFHREFLLPAHRRPWRCCLPGEGITEA